MVQPFGGNVRPAYSSVTPKCHGSIIRTLLRRLELLIMQPNAILALADNSVFRGYAIAATRSRCNELIFHTAVTGYQ